MNLEVIQNIPFKEKKFFVYEACLIYKKLKKIHNHQKLLVSTKKHSSFYQSYNKRQESNISMFEIILNLLDPEQKLIINNEYLDQRYDQRWYEEKWSKTTYYKIKHQAIDNFLLLFYA